MASVAMCLGVVLGDFVNSDQYPHFAHFLLLLEIISSLQCYSFTEEDLHVLECNIERYISNHVLLYLKTSGAGSTIHHPKVAFANSFCKSDYLDPHDTRGVLDLNHRMPRSRK